MPIFKAGSKLVLYAHVPKCGGSSVSQYLSQRFGLIAFNDTRYLRHQAKTQWSRTSPQHVDANTLGRLFPEGFFDASFTIVRHPVARLISAYHFQLEVENRIPSQTGFSDWLEDISELMAEDPFTFDNHVRPMSEIAPEGAMVFHMEHGLDALVPWFDALAGDRAAPRSMPMRNKRGDQQGAPAASDSVNVRPSDWDLERISEIYAEDFKRFGYVIDSKAPLAPPPELSAQHLAERDAEWAAKARRSKHPLQRMKRKLRRSAGF